MPTGDPWPNVRKLLSAERKIRNGERVDVTSLPRYWADLVRLLQVFQNTGRKTKIAEIKSQMASNVYDAYIDKRATMAIPKKRVS